MISESFERGQRLEKDSGYPLQVQERQQIAENQPETPAGTKRVFLQRLLAVETNSVTDLQLIDVDSRYLINADSSSCFETTLELEPNSLYFF